MGLNKDNNYEKIRQRLNLPYELPDGFEIKVAETESELEQSFQLVHDNYVKKDLVGKHPSGMRITKYHALPSTTVLVVKYWNRVIGTMSIVLDGSFGLPIDHFSNISSYRTRGNIVCEITSLAVSPSSKDICEGTLLHLIRYLFKFCREVIHVDSILCVLSDNHASFYKAMYGFEVMKPKANSKYEYVKESGSEALIMNFDNKYDADRTSNYSWRDEKQNLQKFENHDFGIHDNMPKSEFFKGASTSVDFKRIQMLSKYCPEVLNDLKPAEKNSLRYIYSSTQYLDGLNESKSQRAERDFRFPVACKATVKSVDTQEDFVRVKDISKSGICLQAYPEIPLELGTKGDVLTIVISLSPSKSCTVTGRLVFMKKNKTSAGIEILSTKGIELDEFLLELQDDAFGTSAVIAA